MKPLISVNTTIKFMGLLVLGVFVVWPLWYLFTYLNRKAMYNKIKDSPKVYIYDTLMGSLRFAQFIKSKRHSKAFIKYYELAEKQILYDKVEFPPNFMPVDVQVHLRNPEDLYGNSLIVEVIDIDSCSPTYEYTRCYIYRATMHVNPPPDSLLKKHTEYWQRRSDSLNIPRMYFEP